MFKTSEIGPSGKDSTKPPTLELPGVNAVEKTNGKGRGLGWSGSEDRRQATLTSLVEKPSKTASEAGAAWPGQSLELCD